MIGDNDITEDSSPDEVAQRIISAISTLKHRFTFVSSFVICQLLPRYARSENIPPPRRTFINYQLYNPIAHQVNVILKREADNFSGLSFFYCGFFFPCNNETKYTNAKISFSCDGVHLSKRGLKKTCHSIRGPVIQHSRQPLQLPTMNENNHSD